MSDILQLGESDWRCSHQPPLPSLHSLYEGEVPGDLKLSPAFSPDTLVSCLIKIWFMRAGGRGAVLVVSWTTASGTLYMLSVQFR